jgi:hypothetical protein
MSIDDILNNPGSQKIEIKDTVAILRILEKSIQNQNILASILKTQLELKELLKGKVESDFDELVDEKLNETLKNAFEMSDKQYLNLIDQIIDRN